MLAIRSAAAAFAVAALVSPAVAEDKIDAAKLVGVWEVTKSDEIPAGSKIEFTKDGKVKVSVKVGDADMVLEGKYKADGSKLSVSIKIGDDEKTDDSTIVKLTDEVAVFKGKDDKMIEVKKAKK